MCYVGAIETERQKKRRDRETERERQDIVAWRRNRIEVANLSRLQVTRRRTIFFGGGDYLSLPAIKTMFSNFCSWRKSYGQFFVSDGRERAETKFGSNLGECKRTRKRQRPGREEERSMWSSLSERGGWRGFGGWPGGGWGCT